MAGQQQPVAPVLDDDPDAFAQSLGGQIGGADDDPDAFAASLDGQVEGAQITPRSSFNAPEVVSRRGGIPTRPTGLPGTIISGLETGVDAARAVGRSIDPRSPEGRKNLASTAAAGGMAYLTGGTSALPWITRILATPVAAAFGGAAAEAGEQVAGTKPVSSGINVAAAGAEQGAYEIGGKLFMWPIRRGVAMFKAAPAVARAAKEKVQAGVQIARNAGTELIENARETGRRYMTGERAAAAQGIRTARNQAREELVEAETWGQQQVDRARGIYDELVKDAPSQLDAQQAVRRVVNPRDTSQLPKGAAQRALDMAGAQVAEAAQTGPPIALGPLQQSLDQMASAARPTAIFGNAAADVQGMGFLAKVRAAKSPIAAGLPTGTPGANSAVDETKMMSVIAKELGIPENHPLPGILGKIATTDAKSLTFAEAHQLKKLLDEAVNWNDPARKHVEQITKGLRTQLREAMAVHEPYNAATEAFQRVVPLYRRGVGKELIRAATDNPDKITRMLKASDPARAQAIKDLLVEQSAKGGDSVGGREAWQRVQGAWVYDNIITGGPEKLSQRVATILTETPEFAKILFDDPTAQKVLSNIDRIGQVYQSAVQQQGAAMVAAKTATKAGVETAKDAASARLAQATADVSDTMRATKRTAQAGVTAAVAEKQKFAASSLMPFSVGTINEMRAADLARVGVLGLRTFTGSLALIRLLSGPKNADLLEWAAYSDSNTQRLVAALQSRLPDTGVAALMRELATVARGSNDDAQSRPTPAPHQ